MSDTLQTIDDRLRQAYQDAYDDPIKLTAEGGVHADSMPRVRRTAGNTDDGPGTYTIPTEIAYQTRAGGADTLSSGALVDDVARAMIAGTRDQFEDRDPDPERAL